MGHRLVTAAVAVLLTGGLAGCNAGAGPGSGAGPGGTPAPGGEVSVAPSVPRGIPSAPIRTLPPTGKAPGKPTPASGEMTLTGVVTAGVEPHCLLLKSGGRTYQLVDGDPEVVREGARLVVTGHLVTGMMSYCMQGLMFHVSSARPG